MKKLVFAALAIAGVLFLAGCPNQDGPTSTTVSFISAEQTGGVDGTMDSTGLILTFDIDPATLAASDITITGAAKGELSGSGTTRTLGISGITVANGQTISIAIADPNGYTISGSPQTATVYCRPVYSEPTGGPYEAGDTGQAGGIVFYVNPNADDDGWKYLEAATSTMDPNPWTTDTISGGSLWDNSQTPIDIPALTNFAANMPIDNAKLAPELGKGKANTKAIVAQLDGSARPANECANYKGGGYDDWFLPSIAELKYMYDNLRKEDKGGFSNTYWSSSESNGNTAWCMFFDGANAGVMTPMSKNNNNLQVRPCRAFLPLSL